MLAGETPIVSCRHPRGRRRCAARRAGIERGEFEREIVAALAHPMKGSTNGRAFAKEHTGSGGSRCTKGHGGGAYSPREPPLTLAPMVLS